MLAEMVSIEIPKALAEQLTAKYGTRKLHLISIDWVKTLEKLLVPPEGEVAVKEVEVEVIKEPTTETELDAFVSGLTSQQVSFLRKQLQKQRYTKHDIAAFIGALSQNQLKFLRDELCTLEGE